MTLRERVKELCKKKGVSLNKAEEELGFAKGYLSKLGTSTPNAKNLQKIAKYLNVTSEFLTDGTNYGETFSKENAHLIEKIRNDSELSEALKKYFALSEEKKKHIVELINLLSE